MCAFTYQKRKAVIKASKFCICASRKHYTAWKSVSQNKRGCLFGSKVKVVNYCYHGALYRTRRRRAWPDATVIFYVAIFCTNFIILIMINHDPDYYK